MDLNRSRSSGNRGHVRPERPVTFLRNSRSRSAGIGGHVAPKYSAPSTTYYYRYDKALPATSDGKTPAADGAAHSGEIEYALGNLGGNDVYAWTPDDEKVSQTMQGFFANFINTGNPNGAGLPTWPAYTSGQVMVIDVHSRAEHDGARDRRRFMDQLPASH